MTTMETLEKPRVYCGMIRFNEHSGTFAVYLTMTKKGARYQYWSPLQIRFFPISEKRWNELRIDEVKK